MFSLRQSCSAQKYTTMGGDSIEQAVSVSEKKSPSPAMTDDSNTSSHADKEAGTHQTVELKRNLKSRHIQMIAIGEPFSLPVGELD